MLFNAIFIRLILGLRTLGRYAAVSLIINLKVLKVKSPDKGFGSRKAHLLVKNSQKKALFVRNKTLAPSFIESSYCPIRPIPDICLYI